MCLKGGVTSLHSLCMLIPRFNHYMTMLVIFKWLLSTPQEKTEVETPVLLPLDLEAVSVVRQIPVQLLCVL